VVPEAQANPISQLASQYKQGYKTSEFWVAIIVGLVQTLVIAFDPNKSVSAQLSNLTWVAITYIVARGGLKVVRANSAAKVVAASSVAAAVPAATARNGGDYLERMHALVQLRDEGALTPDEFQNEKARIWLTRA
jgi:hypothetical protein